MKEEDRSEVEAVALNYEWEVRNMTTRNLSHKDHHVSVSGQTMRSPRKWSSYGNIPSHSNYKVHDKVPTRHSWQTDEMDETSRLSDPGTYS